MAILGRVRRLFTSTSPVEIDISTRSSADLIDDATPPGPLATAESKEAVNLLSRIETRLDEGRLAQDRTAQSLGSLPVAIDHLARVANRQDELLEAVRDLAQADRRRAESESAVLDRLADMVERESSLLSLVQRQLDANHAVVQETAGRLEQLSTAVHEASRTNRVTAEAMEVMVGEMKAREARNEDRASAMQAWIVTCVVACVAATAAALALAWIVLGRTG